MIGGCPGQLTASSLHILAFQYVIHLMKVVGAWFESRNQSITESVNSFETNFLGLQTTGLLGCIEVVSLSSVLILMSNVSPDSQLSAWDLWANDYFKH